MLQSDVVLTQRLLPEYIAALRSCTLGLARLGPPTGRLRPAAAIAKDACRDYERGAATYRRLAPLLAVGATGEVSDLLQQAAEHEGNDSNGLRRGEVGVGVTRRCL